VDPLLAGLSEEAARIVDPAYRVNPAANYYFMAASTFVITAAGTWLTERLVVPRLGAYTGDVAREKVEALSREERRGLRFALFTAIAFTLVYNPAPCPQADSCAPEDGYHCSPFLSGIVTLIFLFGALTGITYGVGRTLSDKA
jgi:aminobenzoyl-glutamate transport protein